MQAAGSRFLHPDLVAEDQFSAVPPLQAQQARADQAQEEREDRIPSSERIPPVVQGEVDGVEQHEPETDHQVPRRGLPGPRPFPFAPPHIPPPPPPPPPAPPPPPPPAPPPPPPPPPPPH